MYHDNPVLNNIILTIINDGNGSECGTTYDDRIKFAGNYDTASFYAMTRHCAERYGDRLTAQQVGDAAMIVYSYYVNHNTENTTYAKKTAS